MKMDEMNNYFESKGFEVKRTYDCKNNSYEFVIRDKDGNYYRDVYTWPEKYEKTHAIIEKDMNKKNSIRKAYDILVRVRDEDRNSDVNSPQSVWDIEEVIGYLGEALED